MRGTSVYSVSCICDKRLLSIARAVSAMDMIALTEL